uniref:Uncharacterized protein n=1 Tax=Physcomitrium patens TaxID=3218 RepID=A0A2K1IAE8_PHYPA|nr:hypothetical protein PHYPA_030823 [Physcomitrium patens]
MTTKTTTAPNLGFMLATARRGCHPLGHPIPGNTACSTTQREAVMTNRAKRGEATTTAKRRNASRREKTFCTNNSQFIGAGIIQCNCNLEEMC